MQQKFLQKGIVGLTALVLTGTALVPSHAASSVTTRALTRIATADTSPVADPAPAAAPLATVTRHAVDALAAIVRPLSHPRALEDAFHSYYAFKALHPDQVRKPYLYFVDYGLPSTTPRGYLFNMNTLTVVEGPFTVAHGRGSSATQYGVPTRFSNAFGSAATSLGLYIARATYAFTGHAAGRVYSALGLRLDGVSDGFNDHALARGVVAHGAPYVTPDKAGRSQGCPAMEPSRAERLLPKLADGGMVFLFAPDANWLTHDEWVANSGHE